METKIKINIWSDFVCPFCYIGKRKFDKALEQFEHREDFEIIWRSFQLFPQYRQKTQSDFFEEVGNLKGMSRDRSVLLHNRIAEIAKDADLQYQFDKITFPNTFDAHRLSHFAKKEKLQNELEEKLFSAYFTEGKNINDKEILSELAEEIGLDKEVTKEVLYSNKFARRVKEDIDAAKKLGITGVPHFEIDNKLYISGAQDIPSFLNFLTQVWQSRQMEPKDADVQNFQGASCSAVEYCGKFEN